jgi:UDP-N-acetylglucosamine:LPS N-acetylglucosamine transferase
MVAQSEATPERIADRLEQWIQSPASLLEMARRAVGMITTNATDEVVAVLTEAAHAND